MNSKEKVLSVYPDAYTCCELMTTRVFITRGPGRDLSHRFATEAEAWDDAANQLPSAPSPAGETAEEDWFPYPVAVSIAPAAVSEKVGSVAGWTLYRAVRDFLDSARAGTPFGLEVMDAAVSEWEAENPPRAKPSAEGDGWIAVTERLPNVAKADHCCIPEDEAPTISEPVIVWNEDDCEQVIAELEIVDGSAAGAVWHSRETGNEIYGVIYWKPSAHPSGQGEVE